MPIEIEPSKRAVILERFLARLERITKQNGFATDAGLTIYTGALPGLTKADPPLALAVLVGDDEPDFHGEHIALRLPIEVAVTIRADLADGWTELIEPGLADLKRAVELTDRRLGMLLQDKMKRGPTRTLPREPGSEMIGASITWTLPYVEMWGDP